MTDWSKIREMLSKVPDTEWVSGAYIRPLWNAARRDDAALKYIEDHLKERISGFHFNLEDRRKYQIGYDKEEDLVMRIVQKFTFEFHKNWSWWSRMLALCTICWVIRREQGCGYSQTWKMRELLPILQGWCPKFQNLKVEYFVDHRSIVDTYPIYEGHTPFSDTSVFSIKNRDFYPNLAGATFFRKDFSPGYTVDWFEENAYFPLGAYGRLRSDPILEQWCDIFYNEMDPMIRDTLCDVLEAGRCTISYKDLLKKIELNRSMEL